MPAAAVGAFSVIAGSAMSANAASKASKAQVKSQGSAIDEQRRQYDQTRADYAPYLSVGTGALGKLAGLYGIAQEPQLPENLATFDAWSAGQLQAQPVQKNPRALPGKKPAAPSMDDYNAAVSAWRTANPAAAPGATNFSDFTNSPDYQFNLQENLKAVEGGAAARGGLYSGAAMKALQDRGAGVASQQFSNYTNRLAALAGIGQTATNAVTSAGSANAGNVGNLLIAQGDARASGVAGSANAWNTGLGAVAAYGSNYWQNRRPNGVIGYTGNRQDLEDTYLYG